MHKKAKKSRELSMAIQKTYEPGELFSKDRMLNMKTQRRGGTQSQGDLYSLQMLSKEYEKQSDSTKVFDCIEQASKY